VVLVLSAATRYYRLDEPRGVVFDEGHFGRFTNQYNDGQFLFDIHPPLGKLVFYWASRAVGYDWRVCDYSPRDHRELYKESCKYVFIRATAAFFGTFTPLLAYHIARNWSASVPAAFLAALFVIVDGLNVTEARLILVDSQLIFWCAAALLLAQRWWARWNAHTVAAEEFERLHGREYGSGGAVDWEASGRDPRLLRAGERWRWCLACGVVFGNAVSVKWTGLATPGESRGGGWSWVGRSREARMARLLITPIPPPFQKRRRRTAAMIALESVMGLWFLRRAVPWPDLLRIAGVALLTYAHWFWWHFHLGVKTGASRRQSCHLWPKGGGGGDLCSLTGSER
jgi:hypothetical protein